MSLTWRGFVSLVFALSAHPLFGLWHNLSRVMRDEVVGNGGVCFSDGVNGMGANTVNEGRTSNHLLS